MSKLPWLRLWNETLHDQKIDLISTETGIMKPTVMGVWCSLLMLASESPVRGEVLGGNSKPLPLAYICTKIGIDQETFQVLLEQFADMEMLEIDEVITIKNWDSRQFKSDNSYERVKKWRRKEAKKQAEEEQPEEEPEPEPQGVDNAYTKRFSEDKRNVSETFQETPQITESESDIDNNNNNARASPDFDQKWARFSQLYEASIGTFSIVTVDELKEYCDKCPVEWLEVALKRSEENNARKWSYTRAILDRFIAAGHITDKPRGNSNGQSATHSGKRKTSRPPPGNRAAKADRAVRPVDLS